MPTYEPLAHRPGNVGGGVDGADIRRRLEAKGYVPLEIYFHETPDTWTIGGDIGWFVTARGPRFWMKRFPGIGPERERDYHAVCTWIASLPDAKG